MIDRPDSLQERVIGDAPRAHRVVLRCAEREAEQIDVPELQRVRNAIASRAISDTVLGTFPEESPTLALSSSITSRSAAMASTRSGSQLSRLPRKCRKTSGSLSAGDQRIQVGKERAARVGQVAGSAADPRLGAYRATTAASFSKAATHPA